MKTQQQSTTKRVLILIFVVVFGFVLFALPNVFIAVTNFNGGLIGPNLAVMAIFQLLTVSALLFLALKWLGEDFQFIGWSFANWQKDLIWGGLAGLAWLSAQFLWIIPATGGAERPDIVQAAQMLDGTILGLLSLIALGVIGGGIAEEIYNRGFFINVLKSCFKSETIGLWIAAILSILFFAAGHLPTNEIEWIDILVPTIMYTLLFIKTKRLTASMIAHGLYNAGTAILIHLLYL